MEPINVLSLFDGMGCGRIALERLGIPIRFYFASEIDKHAIGVTRTKYPQNIHKGSVTDISAYDLPKIDLLLGGSPCQGFSFAGKGLNFDDPRSSLFFEYVRILKECRKVNPKVLFLLENVRMKKEHEDVISRILEIQPININSNLVSAQNRERLYWTNIAIAQRGLFGDNYCTIPQPKDKNIFLRDILQQEVDEKYCLGEKALNRLMKENPKINPDKSYSVTTHNNTESGSRSRTLTLIQENAQTGVLNDNGTLRATEKANCIDANYFKGMDNHSQRTMIVHTLEPICVAMRGRNPEDPSDRTPGIPTEQRLEPNHTGKTNCLTSVSKDNLILQRARGDNPGGERAIDGKVPCLSANHWEHNNHLVVKAPQAERVYDTDDKSVTIGARQGGMGAGTGLYNIKERIRRLTPIECCRLQTVPDDYFFHEGKQIVSDSQIYKMIGNGWTIDAIAHILSYAKFENNQGTERTRE